MTVAPEIAPAILEHYPELSDAQRDVVGHVDRLLLFWTSEPRKADALMVLPYDPRRVEGAGRHFDDTVRRIQAREFEVRVVPEAGICKECDLRMLCHAEGIISREGRG